MVFLLERGALLLPIGVRIHILPFALITVVASSCQRKIEFSLPFLRLLFTQFCHQRNEVGILHIFMNYFMFTCCYYRNHEPFFLSLFLRSPDAFGSPKFHLVVRADIVASILSFDRMSDRTRWAHYC